MSIGKVLALAAVYTVPVQEIIAEAPPDLADYLRAGLAERWADRDAIVNPPALPVLLDEEGYAALREPIMKRARRITVPLGEESSSERMLPGLLLSWLLPILLDRRKTPWFRAFWRRYADAIRHRVGTYTTPWNDWHRVTLFVREHIAHDETIVAEVDEVLDWWTYSATDHLAACHLRDNALDRRWGFELLPAGLVSSLRTVASIQRIAPTRPSDLTLPEPPDLLAGLRHDISLLLTEDRSFPDTPRQCRSIAFAARLLAELAGDWPELGEPVPADVLQAAADAVRKARVTEPDRSPPRRAPRSRRGP